MPSNAATAWPLQVNRDHFYGNPRGSNGRVSADWERAYIVRVEFPWDTVLAWDPHTRVRSARVHRLCALSLDRILKAIWAASGHNQVKIGEWGMHLYGGAFEFRPVRGGTQLSSHSWGCAIDFDPVRNAFGDHTPHLAMVPAVLDAFAAEGWTWGGHWAKPDGMHFQAARVA